MTEDTSQNVGPHFSLEVFHQARSLAWEMLTSLKNAAKIGMKKEDFLQILESPFFFPDREKWWHPIKIRLGKNTQCSFRDKDIEEAVLKEGDLYFFDIGPVFQGHEADVGQTFRLGDEGFINPAETLFKKLELLWQREGITGEKLYVEGLKEAERLGFEFNPKMVGHRLGDFPHAIHHKGSLGSFKSQPIEDRWILEVHLVDKKNQCGYFYEDLLRSL